jgi:hypothetical protein
MDPAVLMRPILLPVFSVNHSAPSGPTAIEYGLLDDVGIVYSVIDGGSCANATIEQVSAAPASPTDLRANIILAVRVYRCNRIGSQAKKL